MLLERLVIGSCLESIVYAFLTDSYYIPVSTSGPMFYEKADHKILLSDSSQYTWSRIQTILALEGRLLNYADLELIKIQEDQIKITTSSGLFKYEFGLCEIFDTTNVKLENEIMSQRDDQFLVIDDFEVSVLGGKHAYLQPKMSEESLAKEIHFYTSDRVDGANYVTDCVVESLLTKQQLNDFEFSDSMVRFAVIHYLTSIGIHGNFMNLYKSGKPKYRKPKVVHKKRIILKKERNVYKDSEKVKFLDMSMKEVLDAVVT